MTHREWTKEALLQGRTITPLDALNEIRCFRLGGRIYDLRKDGMDIKTEIAEDGHYAKYSLVQREDGRLC